MVPQTSPGPQAWFRVIQDNATHQLGIRGQVCALAAASRGLLTAEGTGLRGGARGRGQEGLCFPRLEATKELLFNSSTTAGLLPSDFPRPCWPAAGVKYGGAAPEGGGGPCKEEDWGGGGEWVQGKHTSCELGAGVAILWGNPKPQFPHFGNGFGLDHSPHQPSAGIRTEQAAPGPAGKQLHPPSPLWGGGRGFPNSGLRLGLQVGEVAWLNGRSWKSCPPLPPCLEEERG